MNIKIFSLTILILFMSFNSVYANIDRALFNIGLSAYNRGDYEKAIETLEKIFYEYPESVLIPKVGMYLGYIYYDEKEYEKAKKFLLASVKSSTKGSEVWISSMKLLGVIYYEEGNSQKYEKIFYELKRYSGFQDKQFKKGTLDNAYVKKEKTKLSREDQPFKGETTNTVVVLTNYITNYVTNVVVLTNLPEVSEQTNYITNVVLELDEKITNILKVKEKVEEVKSKEEELEELNRLSDIKNRLLKLNEKALMIKEILQKQSEEKR
ncbi:MAG: tetratricopeptide repeat protein [Brevinematia bacterium]